MTPHALTDAQWEEVRALLPPQKPATGRPAKDHRTVLDGILWQLTTGLPWRNLPERFGPWQTVYSRFRRWQQAGIWDRVVFALRDVGGAEWALESGEIPSVRARQPNPVPNQQPAVMPVATPRVSSSNSGSGSSGTPNRWAW